MPPEREALKTPDASDEAAGWRATIDLEFVSARGRTVLRRAEHRGPLRVQRALYPEGNDVCHVYLVHPPGGVVGNDSLEVTIHVGSGAHVVVTTPGAQRLYRSAHARARIAVTCRIDAGGVLEYLPQETIAYSGSRAAITLDVNLAPGARFFGWEITVLGRLAAGARYVAGELDQRLVVTTNARPALIEHARYRAGDELLTARWGMAGHTVSATLVAVGAVCSMPALRDTMNARAHGAATSASQVDDGILVGRYLGDDSIDARMAFESARAVVRPELAGKRAVAPRIWAT